jgi:large subunit ribosomal protein L25
VHLIGKSAGEKMGGLVNQVLKSIHVECLPADIPQFVDLDVTNVELDQVLHVSDLSLSDKVKILHRSNEAVVTVHLEKVQKEETEEAVIAEGETVAAEDTSNAKEDSTKKEA